ncbi:MAG: hypothetical protein QOC86_368 [Gaiellales bacterium]|jgi:hypothetical protein|nr:hypothetical protein [Gaiellales bacterium]
MTELDSSLHALGDRLERAAAADLAGSAPWVATRRPSRITRRLAVLVAVLAVGVTGVAIAADQLISTNDVAQSMPAGTLALAGTEPTCTVVAKDVEFHCVLARAPASEVTDAKGNPAWKGTVEASVDSSKHVNGGCRSLAQDGREWECYIGQAAVDQKIIGQSLLGEFAPAPGVG